jgi:peptidyl-prolyl cis-trans isomerase B (cyclophilin B)
VLRIEALEQAKTIQKQDTMSEKKLYAIIETEKGVMKAELYKDETPGTVQNFVDLANHNFYDGLTFHRVIPDFVIQGGCPRGDGTGGPGYRIKCETSAPRQYHDRGVMSMAHAGKDTGGSQFFICHCRENTQHLDGRHTCFGKVIEGLDVIDDIRPGDRMLSVKIVEE